jgi:hypothetical protein
LTTCTTTLTDQDLGGMTLGPGVYCFASTAQLSGRLTFDAAGNANAVFIVKTGSTLTTAVASSVALSNGAKAGNVFWQVGSSATLGAATNFSGNLLALQSISVTTGVRVLGRLLALNAAVTIDTNVVDLPSAALATSMGPGCGAPPPILFAIGVPTLGNATFALRTFTAPNASVLLFRSFGAGNVLLAAGAQRFKAGAGRHGKFQ